MLVLIFHALTCSEICRDDRRRRLFVTARSLLLARSRLFAYHLPINFYMCDAEMNFLVTYGLDLAYNVVFCILSALR